LANESAVLSRITEIDVELKREWDERTISITAAAAGGKSSLIRRKLAAPLKMRDDVRLLKMGSWECGFAGSIR
jgi:hypothetical protein